MDHKIRNFTFLSFGRFFEKVFILLTTFFGITAIYLLYKTFVIDINQFDYSV